MMVTVPAGAVAGQVIPVSHSSQLFHVTVPPGLQPGQAFTVQ
eukprot:COSAG01_NODE_26373_length_716_cov_0.693679_1_plen_41_part_10